MLSSSVASGSRSVSRLVPLQCSLWELSNSLHALLCCCGRVQERFFCSAWSCCFLLRCCVQCWAVLVRIWSRGPAWLCFLFVLFLQFFTCYECHPGGVCPEAVLDAHTREVWSSTAPAMHGCSQPNSAAQCSHNGLRAPAGQI